MKLMDVQRRVVPFAAAMLVVIQMPTTLAGGQGARVPGGVTPALEAAGTRSHRPVEITFTKWVNVVDGFNLLEGFTGGDIVGEFMGESLQSQRSYNGEIQRIEATYGVQAGDRSFTALIRGGRTTNPGDAILDGVILAGWRTGAPVHVEFRVVPAPSPTESGCEGAPAGKTCFQGTIQVGRAPRD
jgi:hypothetical protein